MHTASLDMSLLQIAIAKANSIAGTLDSVMSQDLGLGDGEGVEQGDSVEVQYTGWQWENHGPGQVMALV